MATLVTMETPVLSRLPPNSTVLTPVSTPPLSLSHQIGIAILVLAFVFGFPGNLFVVWSILCKVRRRSVTCLLILNLALADALVLLSAPLFLRFLAGGRGWEFGSAMCKTVHYLCCVNMYASIYLICLMSLDRWLAVTKPFLSQRMRTKKRLLLIMLGIWVMAFLMALPMPFYRSLLQIPSVPIYVCMPYHWKSVGHEIFQYISETLLGFLVPFTFILVCYISVICRLRNAMFQRKGRGSILILLIIGAFAVFWLPYHLINILQVIGLIQGSSSSLLKAAKVARPNVTAFAFLSSSINPVLYVFAGSSHIRQAGLCFMAKLFEATNSESTRSTRSSRGSNAESSVLNKLSIKLSHKRDDTRAETPGEGEGPTAEVYSRDEIKTLTTLQ